MSSGLSATVSGLLLVPMTVGIILTIQGTAGFIARTGRYEVVTVAGVAIILAAAVWMTTSSGDTSLVTIGAMVFTLGVAVFGTLFTTRLAERLAPVFWYLVPSLVVALVLALFLREIPLATEAGMVARGEAVTEEPAADDDTPAGVLPSGGTGGATAGAGARR